MKLSEMRLLAQGKILVRLPIQGIAKVGRNDRCVCGSNKKFKKCCLSSYNVALGYIKENPIILDKMKKYLRGI